MKNWKLIPIATLLFVAGCATTEGDPYQKALAEPNRGIVYLYRPAALGGSALTPKVSCAGLTTELRPGSYHPFSANPGHIQCSSSYYDPGNNETVDLDVKPGRDYYVKETIGMGLFIGRVHLGTVDPDEGQTEIQACRELP